MTHWFSILAYRVVMACYFVGIRIAALFGHPKAKLWIEGRKGIFEKMAGELKDDEKRIWVHCASLGEFEQGRVLIEALKKQYPTKRVALSFFSPSAYEICKNYPLADYVFYLPLDTPYNAQGFIQLIQPQLVIFIKYEFWYFYLQVLQQQRIPMIVVAAIFRKNQFFFKWYGCFFKKVMQGITHFFVQNRASIELLKTIGVSQYTQINDTRFDRVYIHAQEALPIPVIEQFKKDRRLIVAGSTWQADEQLLAPFINQAQ